MAYPTGLEEARAGLSQLTRVMYAVWEKMGAEIQIGKQCSLVRTRMLGGVGRVPGNWRVYQISSILLRRDDSSTMCSTSIICLYWRS